MYMWNEHTIRWYVDALAYTGFDRALADILQPYLGKNESVCDLGCGIGYLALELARRGYKVSAIDKNEQAIAWLKSRCGELGLSNLSTQELDWNDLKPEERWDNVVMVCAGGCQSYEYYAHFCRKRLFIIDRVHMESHVDPWGLPSRTESYAHRNDGAGGERRRISLEFGQPFRSLEDARAYFACYYGAESVDRASERLVPTGQDDFPLYLPYRKELEMLVIEK